MNSKNGIPHMFLFSKPFQAYQTSDFNFTFFQYSTTQHFLTPIHVPPHSTFSALSADDTTVSPCASLLY
jgi:hypothetical protein